MKDCGTKNKFFIFWPNYMYVSGSNLGHTVHINILSSSFNYVINLDYQALKYTVFIKLFTVASNHNCHDTNYS